MRSLENRTFGKILEETRFHLQIGTERWKQPWPLSSFLALLWHVPYYLKGRHKLLKLAIMCKLLWIYNFKKKNPKRWKELQIWGKDTNGNNQTCIIFLPFLKLSVTFNSLNHKYRRKVVFLKAKYDSDFTEDMPRYIIWKVLYIVTFWVLVCFWNGPISHFLHRTEKSSGLTNKGQTRGLGSLQQPGNCGLEIYFVIIKLS